MADFQTRYKKLNKEQKDAVESIEGPVMIIAGPGTGKTLTLSMRIAHILRKTDSDPQAILALTFTDSAAHEMRKRLVEIIGPTAYYVQIYTFHSFCTDIIKEFPEEFLISDESAPLSEIERIQLFRDLIDKTDLDILRPTNSTYYYISDIIKKIQELKRENILPSKFHKILEQENISLSHSEKKINPRTGKFYAEYERKQKTLAKQKELLLLYKAYQKRIKELHRFDFEDMINLVVEKLKENQNLKLTLQERYLYILVDEYQDTNASQTEIIRLLTDHWENPNIFVVGDDEQAIYRFQGASLENVLEFKKLFPHAKIIVLTSNYRSSQHILDASRSVIEKNLLRLQGVEKKLKSRMQKKNIPIHLAHFSNGEAENAYIAKEVKLLIKQGTDPDEIAVLVRNNRDIDDIKDTLLRSGIRFEVASGKNILEDGDINRLLLLFRVIHDLEVKPSDDIDLFTLFNFEFLNFKKLDILKLARFASEKKKNFVDIILNEDIFNEVSLEEPKKFIYFIEKLNTWKSLNANVSFTKFFETVIQESNFLNWILSDKLNIARINTLNTLFSEVKQLCYADHTFTLSDFLSTIDLMKENNVKIEEQPFGGDKEAIKLLTAHKAKGLEFSCVFIAKCVDKKWGNFPNKDKITLPNSILRNVSLEDKEKNEDERRLFYVALTRAKSEVYIFYSDIYSSQGYTKQSAPSMFISEIDKKYFQNIDTENLEKKYAGTINTQLTLPPSNEYVLSEEDFLNSVIGKLKLSVTSLNDYLKCPYKFKLNTLLSTPRAKATSQAFGTAIHVALEVYFKTFRQQHNKPQLPVLLKAFKQALEKEILTQNDFKRLISKGNQVLLMYYTDNNKNFTEPLYTEYSFGFRKVFLHDIPLSGKIDKVEWIDRNKKEVKVVDYKTGNPKTKNEIEGKTKNSEGDLLRQLLFYKLLSQLDHNFNFTVTSGEFDFIETKGSRKAKKEEHSYSQEEIEDLKTTIEKVMDKIRHQNFERTKEYRHCAMCPFKTHCWPDGIPDK
jgi:DNA helicase-2/ATP-dependent DNA helicase PcrA